MPYTEKITAQIKLNKVNKEVIYTGKDGDKYITITVVPTPNSEYNQYMIKQYCGKDVDDVILGNGDDLVFDNKEEEAAAPAEAEQDDLPF